MRKVQDHLGEQETRNQGQRIKRTLVKLKKNKIVINFVNNMN